MGYVKMDSEIFNSSLWMDKEVRDIFMVALIAAMPFELMEPTPQLEVESLNETGYIVPPGWYGLARFAPDNLIHKALADRFKVLEEEDEKDAYSALSSLGDPDRNSRSQEFEGRRLVRINNGFLVLNFIKYRDKDHTHAQRQKRYRERLKEAMEKQPPAPRQPRTRKPSGPDPNFGVWKGDQ